MKRLSLCDVDIVAVQAEVQQIFDRVLAENHLDTCDVEDKVRSVFLRLVDEKLQVIVDWVEE